MTVKISEKAKEEVFQAQWEVNRAEEALDRAEGELIAILKKYGMNSPDEVDISDGLPTMAFFNGWKLFTFQDKGHTNVTVLRNRNGEEEKRWQGSPSLTELFEVYGGH